MPEQRTAKFDELSHCPRCQCILHDGPRFWDHCDDCGYDVCWPELREREKPDQPWKDIPDSDPRVELWWQRCERMYYGSIFYKPNDPPFVRKRGELRWTKNPSDLTEEERWNLTRSRPYADSMNGDSATTAAARSAATLVPVSVKKQGSVLRFIAETPAGAAYLHLDTDDREVHPGLLARYPHIPWAHVAIVRVPPTERGKGYGKALVLACLDYAEDHGIALDGYALPQERDQNKENCQELVRLYVGLGFVEYKAKPWDLGQVYYIPKRLRTRNGASALDVLAQRIASSL